MRLMLESSGLGVEPIMPPHAIQRHESYLEELISKVLINFQGYSIEFKKIDGRIFCHLAKDGLHYANVSLVVSKHFTFEEKNLSHPYTFMFYPSQHALVMGGYGMKGGALRAPRGVSEGDLRTLMELDILTLEELIGRRISGIYSSINVNARSYRFLGVEKPAKCISLGITRGQTVSTFFYALFAGLGFFEDRFYSGALDRVGLEEQLLKNICGDRAGVDLIEKAYKRCTAIDLWIAVDGSCVEVNLRESTVIMASHTGGKVVKGVLGYISVAFKIFDKLRK